MKNHYEVIVVGAGSMGMSAGYFLAKEGHDVLLIDAFDPPHDQGSHSGDTRIIRHANGEGLEYIPIALRSQEIWDELQANSNEQIFIKTGVLSFGDPTSDFVKIGLEGAEKYDIEVEYFENGQAFQEQWPDLQLPDDFHGFLEPNAGVLSTENAIRNFRRLALEHGAELSTSNPVLDLDVEEDKVTVTTKNDTYTADKIIISAGAYNNKLLPKVGLDLKLAPTRRVVGWFEPDENLYSSDAFPSFFGDTPVGVYYGFPSIGGTGVKIGKYYQDDVLEPEFINRDFGAYDRDEGSLREFLEAYMPKSAGRLTHGAVCMFTNTKDEDFIVDLHPEHSNVAIAAGFSGHGFKHSSAIGEILKDLVTTGETEFDISSFSAQREAVTSDSYEVPEWLEGPKE